MTDAESESREEFYKNLVRVVDGIEFKHNFELGRVLPDPHSQLEKDIMWGRDAPAGSR